MEKLFFDRQPNETQYSKLYTEELIRLVHHLEDKAKRRAVNEYKKEELIKLCKAYYSFLSIAPAMKEVQDPKREKISCVELQEDDFKLVIPVFKKFALKSHTHDPTTIKEVAERKENAGIHDSDGSDDEF